MDSYHSRVGYISYVEKSDRPETAELAILDAWHSRAQLYLPPDLQQKR